MVCTRLGRLVVRKKKVFLLVPIVLIYHYILMADDKTTRQESLFTLKKKMRNNVYDYQESTKYCAIPLQNRYHIQCERLFVGDMYYTKSLSSLDFRHNDTDCSLTSMLSDCKGFRISHGYDGKPISAEEVEFPIAFGIKVHRDPLQAEQLLRTIYRPHNVYCIHVDLKANRSVSDPMLKLAECFDNVFVIQKYRVIYSSIRQPLSDIACMKEVWHRHWKYYIILAGQEFVLKTNLEIVQILTLMNGTNDIEAYPFSSFFQRRYRMRHPLNDDSEEIRQFSTTRKAPFKHNITFLKGSAYGMFSREFVNFILNSTISQELLAWSHDVYAPEEMLWSTLNALPDAPGGYKARVAHGEKTFLSRAMVWKWDNAKCNGKFIRAVCIFSHRDLPLLVSSAKIVANKFNSTYDQLVVDCLEEWIRKKTALGTTVNMNWLYYRNVPHVIENSVHLTRNKIIK